MLSEGALRTKARVLIEQGKLPTRVPVRMWGGPGIGTACSVCGVPITTEEQELELQVERDGRPGLDRFHVHIKCFAAWALECGDISE